MGLFSTSHIPYNFPASFASSELRTVSLRLSEGARPSMLEKDDVVRGCSKSCVGDDIPFSCAYDPFVGDPLYAIPQQVSFEYVLNLNIPSTECQYFRILAKALNLTKVPDHKNMPFGSDPRHAQSPVRRVSVVYAVQVLSVLFVTAAVVNELSVRDEPVSGATIKNVVSKFHSHPTSSC